MKGLKHLYDSSQLSPQRLKANISHLSPLKNITSTPFKITMNSFEAEPGGKIQTSTSLTTTTAVSSELNLLTVLSTGWKMLDELDGELMIDVSSWQSNPALITGKGVG